MTHSYFLKGDFFGFTKTLFVLLYITAFSVGAQAESIFENSGATCTFAARGESVAAPQTAAAAAFAPCNVASDVIGGKAYRDFNYNGQQDGLEPAQAGIEVYLFTCDAGGASTEAAMSVVTDENGEYVFNVTDLDAMYRVEFVIPESLDHLGFTTFGPENGSDVQFTAPGTCDISVGVGNEAEFHQDNPFLTTPCYINGSGDEGTEGGDSLAFLAVEYNAEGENQNIELFSAKEVGSLWGVAYQRATKTVFSSAVLRRHMGFGPGGTGAIYLMDVADINNPSIIDIIDLDALGFDTGTDPRIADPLPGDFDEPNHDTEAFGLTARMSLGDIDISDDGKTLYVVNLFNKELITIDLTDYQMTGTTPGAAQITSTPIPAFNCDIENDWAVWGLNFQAGDLYLGGVCNAETSQDAANLTATVVKYDGTDFTEFFDMDLDFQRGDPFNGDQDAENMRNQWYPWSDDYTVIRTDEVNGRFAYPQPILSDIEFDIDGSVILGFLDRTAQMGGYLNFGPDPNDNTLYSTFSGGDMIRVCNVNGTLVLEGAQPECTNPIGVNWPQGPNGQEFYWEDQFPENPTGNRDRFVVHAEIALGALTLLPGSGDVTATVFDPLLQVNSGGIAWFDNTTGGRDRDYEVFASESGEGVGFPGKSNGLGDLELVCNQAPSEIGNYAWIDCNGDGIQDPCEDPLPGVNVSLFKEDGTLVAETTTNAVGQYYFTDMMIAMSSTSADTKILPATTYYVVFGTGGQYDSDTEVVTVDGTEYSLTAADSGQAPNADLNDSDPSPDNIQPFTDGLPAAVYTTPCIGAVNHTIDAGFSTGVVMIDVEVTDASCPEATDGSITVTATTDDDIELEYSIDGVTFQPENVFDGLAPGTYTVTVQPAGGGQPGECGGTASTEVTVGAGENPAPPTTTNFMICEGEDTPEGMGLTAMCQACTAADGTMSEAIVTWFDAEVGGNQVATGMTYDPTADGTVDENQTGDYVFFAQCECGPCVSDRSPATFTVTENPTPEIIGDSLVCPDALTTFTVAPLNPGHIFTWEAMGSGIEIVGSNTGETVTVQVTGAPGSGPFALKVTETGPAGTDCMGMDMIEIFVKEVLLVCDDNVQVSLDTNGCAVITPDVILEGINGSGVGCYEVNITTPVGQNLGDKVTCDNIGQTLTVNVASLCEDNSCWGTIIIEDKLAPVFDCDDLAIELDCTEDPDDVPAPTATDNCGAVTVNLANEIIDENDFCGDGVIITRTFIAIDEEGNESTENCEQTIIVSQPELPVFPEDITWQCDQYEDYPNITDVAPLAANIPDNDPTTEAIDVPFWLSQTTLAATGSGTVDVAEGLYCNYAVSSSDDTLSVCVGLKIVRTWTLLNWCTGQVILEDENGNDNVQVVKVTDQQSPVIVGSDFTVQANIPGEHPQECKSTAAIPIPAVNDNCSAVLLHIFTPIGEAVYVNGEDATDGAFIPAPGLETGTHTLTFIAADECDNQTTTQFEVTVTDELAPTVICDEITDVVLNSQGIATVQAIAFDDGSNDNCCIDDFFVKRVSDPETAFAEEIIFNCDEAGETVPVMMQVVDCYGNSAACTIEVNVEDKSNPLCFAPQDTTVTCINYFNQEVDYSDTEVLEELFGTAIASDNCEATVTESAPIINVDNCGNGSIIRNFIAEDQFGNQSTGCSQTIFVEYAPEYTLTFPADFDGSCGELPEEANVFIESENCDLIAVSTEDQVFNLSDDGACYKIIRRYEVINWCTYVSGETPVQFNDEFTVEPGEIIDETTFDNAGILIYTQNIKITDDIAPVLSYAGETEFCINDACIEGAVSLPIDIDENCTSDLDILWFLDANNNGEFDANGGGLFDGTAPLGDHRLLYIVEDGCGNAATTEILFSVVDCKAPVAYCTSGIIIDLMDTNPPMVQVWASDLDAGSFDNCGGEVTFAFSENPLDTGLVLTCTDVSNQTTPVNIYVFDESGNFDYCLTQIIVQDNASTSNGNPCIGSDDPVIAGIIATETGEGLQGTTVELNGNGNDPTTTDEEGAYSFTATAEYDYSVTALNDADHDNGVTVYDLLLVKKHILNTEPLDSPYKMIAADANNSQSITTADIVTLRRLILNVDTELANNTSWRAVAADYTFPDPQNPWAEDFPEVISYNNLSANQMTTDFIAVKIGDINGSAAANLMQEATERTSNETLRLGLQNFDFRTGETFTLDITAGDYRDVNGWQFTLDFAEEIAELNTVETTAYSTQADFATHRNNGGKLTVAHYDEVPQTLAANEVLFTLHFIAKTDGNTADFLQIKSDPTPAVAYNAQGTALQIALTTTTANDTFTLYQNRPNPVTASTEIPFRLPQPGPVSLTVYDLGGKVIFRTTGDYTAGNHTIALQRGDLGSGSVFYYRMETKTGAATRKMVVVE